MEFISWLFTALFWITYIVMLFTVCALTFQKGRTLLGIIGIFLPFLWLIGAILPAKPGSRYEIARARNQQYAMDQMTS